MRRSRFYRRRRPKPKPMANPAGVSTELRQSPALSVHVRRAQAQLIIDEGVGRPKSIYEASVILNELLPEKVTLFSEVGFELDQQVTLNIPHIRNFFIKGRVRICKELSLNPGLLTAKAFRYRVTLVYEFRTEQERQAVKEYCDYLNSEFLEAA